jgi:hypothetical protein
VTKHWARIVHGLGLVKPTTAIPVQTYFFRHFLTYF